MAKKIGGTRKSNAELLRLQKRLKAEVASLKRRHAEKPGGLERFEASHAGLVEAVNELCSFLAKLGI